MVTSLEELPRSIEVALAAVPPLDAGVPPSCRPPGIAQALLVQLMRELQAEGTTILEAAALIVKKHIGMLPVVDDDEKLMHVRR